MFTSDPLFEAHQHSQQLHADAAGERLRGRPTRRVLAEALRCAANRLDRRPVVPLNCSPR
jgi:hypothetical protein